MSAGVGSLSFQKIGTKTVVTDAFAKSPLKFLTPKNSGIASWVYSSNFGGGFVGGDAIEIGLQVGPRAEVVFLSQASTKVYRSENGCLQSITGEIGEDAVLFSIPDPVVCFAGAKFHQKQNFKLEPSSSLMLLDTLHCGREHAGERWAFDNYRNEIVVMRNGKKIFLESMLLNSDAGDLVKRHSRFNAISLLIMVGPAFKGPSEAILNYLMDKAPKANDDLVISASKLKEDGIVIRMASISTEILDEAIKEALHFLPERLGDNPWARKW
jgi:urease accessory protein